MAIAGVVRSRLHPGWLCVRFMVTVYSRQTRKKLEKTIEMKPMKTIYLAGPDVFKPDFVTIRDRLKTLCRANGFIPLSPADGDPIDCDASDLSRQI